jgi:hypothetical protein
MSGQTGNLKPGQIKGFLYIKVNIMTEYAGGL